MLTRCPKCQTLFRISENQLHRARGKTRCGECFTVFEAKKATVEEAAPASPPRTQRRTQASQSDADTQKFESNSQQSGMSSAASSIYNEMVIQNRTVKYDIPDTLEEEDTQVLNDFSMPGAPAPAPTTPPFPEEQHSEEVTRRIELLRRKATNSGLKPASSQIINQQLNELQPPPRRVEASENNFIPDILQDDLYEEIHVPSARKNYFMMLSILALLFVLLVQFVYFSRERLASNPTLHPYLVSFCKLFKCKVPYRKNIDLIKVRSFRADRLSENPTLGKIRVVFFNRAPYIQPYPILEITVRDKSNNLVRMRRIPPKDYLQKNISIKSGLKPSTLVEVELTYKIPTKEDPSVKLDFL